MAPAPHSASLRRNRNFLLLCSGQTVSTFGDTVALVVFPLLILSLTHSPTQAGIAAALGGVPFVILGLPAGALADRWDRKRVMILCDAGRALNFAGIPLAGAAWHLTVPQLYLAAAIEGILGVFFTAAETASLPRVVSKEQLPTAASANEVAMTTVGVVAPPTGGFLYQVVGQTVPFLVDAVSYAASVISLLFIKTEFQEERVETQRTLGGEILEGLAWLWNQPLIRFMAFVSAALNFLGYGDGLIIIVLAKHKGASATVIGTIFAISSLGGILGASLAPRIQRRLRFGPAILGSLWLDTLLWPLYILVPFPLLLGLVDGGRAVAASVYQVVQYSYRLALIPDPLQGRVNGANRLIALSLDPLGAVLAGLLIERIGVIRVVMVFTAWMVVLSILATANAHVRRAPPASVEE